MKLNEYQQLAFNFAKYSTPDYPFLALSEEVGEVNGKIAKAVRKWGDSASSVITDTRILDTPTERDLKQQLQAELGDVAWQLAACCTELGLSLEEVCEYNLDKLAGRSSRGTIVGSGDNR